MMPTFEQQMTDMINGRIGQGPKMIEDYGSALENAAKQDAQSIESLRGIYSDPSKFQKSALGAFGLGLMKPTSSGNFGEGMYNAMSSAMEAHNYNKEQNLSREEKLAKLASLQAALTRQQANDSMSVFDKQTGYMSAAETDRARLADLQLTGAQYGLYVGGYASDCRLERLDVADDVVGAHQRGAARRPLEVRGDRARIAPPRDGLPRHLREEALARRADQVCNIALRQHNADLCCAVLFIAIFLGER
jgi:hypothetical protein